MQLTITRDTYKGHRKSPWLVVVPRRLSPTGRRLYRRFASRTAAAAFAAQIRGQVRQHGERPLATVPASLAADAQAASLLLAGTGLTLTDAVRHLLGRGRAGGVASALYSLTGGAGAAAHQEEVSHAAATDAGIYSINATLAALEEARAHQSDATKRTRRSVFNRLFASTPALAETALEACTPASMLEALNRAYPHSAQAWNTARRYLHALFSFAIRRGMASMQNPVTPLDLKHVQEAEITAMLPHELQALFDACRPATAEEVAAAAHLSPAARHLASLDTTCLRPFLAICAFAGVRPAECARLTWGEIGMEEGVLSVRGANSKTGGTRHIPLHPTLRAWLEHCKPIDATPSTPIVPRGGHIVRMRAVRARAGYGGGNPWTQDVLRHSYATHYLKAGIGELSALQYNMGHRDASLLYARYTNMKGVTRAASEGWWQVLPPGEAEG